MIDTDQQPQSHDEQAERIVLGAMMLTANPDLIDQIRRGLDANSFHVPAHALIYGRILAARDSGAPTEPVALARSLLDSGELRLVPGGAAYLHTLVNSVPTVANGPHYARIVAEHASRRRLTTLAAQLSQVAQAPNPTHRGDQVAAIATELSQVGMALPGGRRAQITWADQITPRPVVWAWQPEEGGRVPAGCLCAAAGREGTGKSSFGIWLAAHITRGTLPGAWHGHPRRVLYVAVEDSWEHTLVPRLIATGADLDLVGRLGVVVEARDEVTLSLPTDNTLLERAITTHDTALVVVDPLMSVIGERIDTHRERDVRTALDPLARLADRTGAVILGIAHFNKGGGSDAASLITGSGAFKNVPRSILGFARDESSDTGERVMTQVKNSLGQCDGLPSYAYRITSTTIDTPTGTTDTGRFDLLGQTTRSIADVLRDANAMTDSTERAEHADAATWLTTYLTDHDGHAPAPEIFQAGEECGFSRDTLKRAKGRAGVTSQKSGMGAGWHWALPEGSTKGAPPKELLPSLPSLPSRSSA